MDPSTAFGPGKAAALLVAAVIVGVLLYKDARRLGQLTDLYSRTHHPLVLISMLGALLTAVGMVMMVVGVYKIVTAESQVAMPPGVMLMEIVGGAMVVSGWAIRRVVWGKWKRLFGSGAKLPDGAADPQSPPDGSVQRRVAGSGGQSGQGGKARRRRRPSR